MFPSLISPRFEISNECVLTCWIKKKKQRTWSALLCFDSRKGKILLLDVDWLYRSELWTLLFLLNPSTTAQHLVSSNDQGDQGAIHKLRRVWILCPSRSLRWLVHYIKYVVMLTFPNSINWVLRFWNQVARFFHEWRKNIERNLNISICRMNFFHNYGRKVHFIQ